MVSNQSIGSGMKNNFEHTFLKLIKILKVSVTKTSALQYLQSHPYTGSLLAYVETLDHFKIENAGIRVDRNRFSDLPTPFVAYLNQYGGTFALVKNKTDTEVEWLDTQIGWKISSSDEFLKNWDGVALLTELNPDSGEKDYSEKLKQERLKEARTPLAMGLLVILTIVISFPLLQKTNLTPLLLLKLTGIVTSTLLLVRSIGINSEWINKICNNGPKMNCQSLLDSPAAQITSWLGWADLGFIYFLGSYLAMLVASHDLNTFFSLQSLFSVASVGFALYSIGYQKYKAKMWCTLCLVVVAVFSIELVYLLMSGSLMFDFNLVVVLKILTVFFLPIAVLLIYKPVATKANEQKYLHRKINQIYATPGYLELLFNKQPTMPPLPEEIKLIAMGNPDAPHEITLVSNPLCSPCAAMHKRIEALLEENQNVKCSVIFLSGIDNAGGQFVRKLFSLPVQLREEAMSRWYHQNDKNFDQWNEPYSMYAETDSATDLQKKHNEWINRAEVKGTPTLYLNGRQLPADLNVNELAKMLQFLSNSKELAS